MDNSVGDIYLNLKVDKSDLDSLQGDVERKTGSLEEGAAGVTKGFTVAKAVVSQLVARGVEKLVSTTKEAVQASIGYEQTVEHYKTSFKTMTGSASDAANIMQQLTTLTADTPFEMDGLAGVTNQLMEYGFSAQSAIDSMKMLGDISQGDSEKLNSIALAYGQMSSAGKVQLQDVKQMINVGFNPLEQIAQQTGESMGSLYDRISNGTLSVNEITRAMQNATAKGGKYYNAMKSQSKTLSGMMSTLKEDINQLTTMLLSPIFTWFTETLMPALINMVTRLKAAFSGLFGKGSRTSEIKSTNNALTKQAQALAKTASNTSKAAKATAKATTARKKSTEATKAAEKANRRFLASFDQIHNIDKKSTKSSSSSKKTGKKSPAGGNDVAGMNKALKDITATSKKELPAIWKPFKLAWDHYGLEAVNAAKRALMAVKGLLGAIGESWRKVWMNGTGQKTIELFLKIFTNIMHIVEHIASGIKKAWEYNDNGTKIVQHLWNILNDILAVINKILWFIDQLVKRIDWTSIIAALENILGLLDKISGDLLGGIMKFLDKIARKDFRGAGKTISDTLKSIFDDTRKWLTKIDFSKLGKKLSDAIISALNALGDLIVGINWDDVTDSFMELAGQIVVSLGKFLAGVDWVGVLKAASEAILKAVESILKTHSGRIATILFVIFEGKAVKAKILKAGANLGMTLITGIAKNAPKIGAFYQSTLIPNIVAGIGKVGSVVLPALQGIASGITGIIAAIPVAGWIAIAIAAVAALFAYLYKHNKAFRKWVNGVVKWFKKIPGRIARFLAGIGKTITGWANGVVAFFKKMPGRCVKVAQDIKNGVIGVIKGIFTWISKKINAVKKALGGLGQKVKNSKAGKVLNSTVGKVATAGISLASGNPFAITASVGNLVKSLPHFANGAVLGRNEPTLAVVGDNRHSGEIVTPTDTLQKMLNLAMNGRGSGYDEAVIDLLQRLIDAIDKKDLKIDGDSLENALNKRRDRRYLRTGKAAK